jgi:hypothetical protein
VPIDAFKAAIEQRPVLVDHTDASTFSYGGLRGDGGSLHAEGAGSGDRRRSTTAAKGLGRGRNVRPSRPPTIMSHVAWQIGIP